VTSGALTLGDATRAVRRRGEAMQEAVPVGMGGMAAVMGPSPAAVHALCIEAQKESGHAPIEPANYNCPGQIVISGRKQGIDWLAANLATASAKVPELSGARVKLIPLKVSAPFHCSLM